MSFGLVPIHPNGLLGGQLTDNFQLAVIVPIMVWDWHAILQILFYGNLAKNIVPFSVFVRYISKSTKQEVR